MSIYIPLVGPPRTLVVALSTTDLTQVAVPTSGSTNRLFIESIKIAEISGNATTINLVVNDGSTDFTIYKSLSLSANETRVLADFNVMLRDGWSLKAQASVANRLNIFATVIDMTSQQRGASAI